MEHSPHRLTTAGGMATAQQGLNEFAIAHLALDQRHSQHLFHTRAVPIHEVVEHHRMVPGLLQGAHGVAADVTSTTGDEQGHQSSPRMRRK